jgi:hypothetical protein
MRLVSKFQKGRGDPLVAQEVMKNQESDSRSDCAELLPELGSPTGKGATDQSWHVPNEHLATVMHYGGLNSFS